MGLSRPATPQERTVLKRYYTDIAKRAYPLPLPPEGFDPLSATAQQLEKYGLPARPDARAEPDLFLFWGMMLGPPLQFITAEFPTQLSTEKRLFAPHRHAPGGKRRAGAPAARSFRHSEKSRNWSGAYITPRRPDRFVQVTGGWTVPALAVPTVLPSGATPGTEEYRSSTWIGIDGHRTYPNSSLPQIGTSQFIKVVRGKATVETGAWWQWWVKDDPNNAPVEILNFPVSVGDEILASLAVQASGDVLFHLKNQTSGLFAAFVVIAPGAIVPLGSTAEWIMERPTELHSTRMYPMPHCTDVVFRHCLAKSAPAVGTVTTLQNLDNARLIRMYEAFDQPHRIAFVSHAEKKSKTSARVFYREAGSS
jgi:hypothetical protein